MYDRRLVLIDINEFREDVRHWLPEHFVTVTFIKKNGETREMECTTDSSEIPEDQQPKGTTTHSDDVQPVWDCQKNAWRSFRWDSVVEARIPFTPETIIIKGPMSE